MKITIKCVVVALITVTFFCLSVVGVLYSDRGRSFVLSSFAQYISHRYDLKWTITNADFKNIERVSLELHDKTRVQLDNINISCNAILDPMAVSVNKITFIAGQGDSDLETLRKQIFQSLTKLRRFVSDLSIKHTELQFPDNKTYTLENIRYQSRNDNDCLSCTIDNTYTASIELHWKGNRCINCTALLKQSPYGTGSLTVINPEAPTSEYRLDFDGNGYRVASIGNCKNVLSDISCVEIKLIYDNNEYRASANINLLQDLVTLSSEVSLNTLHQKLNLPEQICDCIVNINISGGLKRAIDSNASLYYRDRHIANLITSKRDELLRFNADVIDDECKNIIKNIEGEICNLHDIKLKFNGPDMDVDIVGSFKENSSLCITKCDLTSSKGWIKLTDPCVIQNNSAYSFAFNFSQLDFFKRWVPISGSGAGEVSYCAGTVAARAKFDKISYQNKVTLFAVDITKNDKKTICKARACTVLDVVLKQLEIIQDNKTISVGCSVNDYGIFHATGELSDNKVLNLNQCKLTVDDTVLIAEKCCADFDKNIYEIRCGLNCKGQNCGTAGLYYSHAQMSCSFENLQIFRLSHVLHHPILKGTLDGKLNFICDKALTGNGELILKDILAKADLIDVKLALTDKGLHSLISMKNHNDFLNADISMPIRINSDFTVSQVSNEMLKCSLIGQGALERLFDLPDMLDIRGEYNSRLFIEGSLASPVVTGDIAIKQAYISVGDLVLKNGDILLYGKDSAIEIKKSVFVDDSKHTASLLGQIQLSFTKAIPHLNVDTRAVFNDFTLFDSDTLRVVVSGNGKISGPIQDLNLTGDVNIPYCEVRDFNSADSTSSSEIKVENVPYLSDDDTLDDHRRDVFNYDVNMHCSNVKFVGSVFELLLRGDLKLSSYNNSGTLVGMLDLVDGKLELFGKRMKFIKGYARFFEEFPFDPKADFLCQRNFGDIEVRLNVKNSPHKGVSINLQSTPSYSEDMVLSIVMFGKDITHLSVGEGAQLAHAFGSLKRRGYIFSILNTLQNIGIVDSLSFSSENKSSRLYSDTTDSSQQNNLNISAGKYLHDNVYVSVNKKDEGTSIDLELSVTPTVSIKANTNNEFGVSWKYRY